jgi:hypothetical protein
LSVRRSGLGRRENARSPGQAAQSPNSAGRPRGESRGSEPGTHEVWVHASRTGGRSRSDASRVLLVGRSQDLVAVSRALAGRKLEALPDAGHEQRQGESVRGGTRFPITGTRAIDLWVSARRFTRRWKAFSGTHASGPHRHGAKGPSVRRSKLRGHSARSASRVAHRAVTETDSGVPANDNESVRGRRGSVKAPRGPRRSKGSPHPRR